MLGSPMKPELALRPFNPIWELAVILAEFSWSSFHRWYGPEFRGGILGFRVAQQIDQRISYIACHSVDPQQPQ